jgi:U3 small nucleolar RNA-associated protein 19
VSGLARVFSEPLSKPPYNLEDFMDHNYDMLFEYEAKEDRTNVPIASQMGLADSVFPTTL